MGAGVTAREVLQRGVDQVRVKVAQWHQWREDLRLIDAEHAAHVAEHRRP
jgi:hypothetical protein